MVFHIHPLCFFGAFAYCLNQLCVGWNIEGVRIPKPWKADFILGNFDREIISIKAFFSEELRVRQSVYEVSELLLH